MKLLVLLTFLFVSFSSFADQNATINAADPQFCGRSSTCVKGYIPLVRSGTYYARATGRNCDQAMANAEEVFVRKYGNMDCGLISGPHLDIWSCRKSGNGPTIAWLKCSPDSGSTGDARTQRRNCVVGGVWICR